MYKLKGITPKIDSCAGLIAQQAYRAHNKLASEHKRWVDPEDLMQEALMEAVRAERRYKKNKGAKYSTYLHNGLFFDLRKTYTDRLRQGKRTSGGLVELDAPISDDSQRHYEVQDSRLRVDSQVDRFKRAVNALEALCRAVSPPVRVAIVESLLFQKQVNYNKKLAAYPGEVLRDRIAKESAEAVARTGVSFSDFSIFSESEKSRKMSLIQLLRNGIVGTVDTDARLLECIGCSGQFPLSAVRDGYFVVSTMTCRSCYKDMASDPVSCFGKSKTAETEGFDETDVECRLHCMDKVVCKNFKGDKAMAKKGKAVEEELEGVDFEETEDEKPKKKTAVKAEKPKAAKKAKVEEDEEPAPADVVKWPYKRGSVMQWMFQLAYAGLTRKSFDEQLTKIKRDPAKWIKILQQGTNGQKSGNPTHTWKLNEEGGRLKLYDVKYVGGKEKKAKAEKVEAKGKEVKAVAKKKAKAA